MKRTSLKGMNFDHDFCYSFPFFSSLPKKRGKKKWRMNYQKTKLMPFRPVDESFNNERYIL